MISLQPTNSLALLSSSPPPPPPPPSSSSSTLLTSGQQQHQWWRCSFLSRNALFSGSRPLTCSRLIRKTNAENTSNTAIHGSSSDSSNDEMQQQQKEEEYRVLTAMQSKYNDIVIVETSQARMLLLDSTHNVHSLLRKDGQKWTGSYWDEFASLPAIVPEGPIAIFGLGGGTAAHLMLDVWPSLELEGWEIDEILIDQARDYFGLSDLEKHNQAGGILHVLIGDALCPSGDNSRRYAGIVIDLFCGGKVLSQLQEVATWLELKNRLKPNGRLMVNCGGVDGKSDAINGRIDPESVDGPWVENHTIEALCKAFPGQVSWKRMPESKGSNYLALTGPQPDLASWSAMVPEYFIEAVGKWRFCSLFQ